MPKYLDVTIRVPVREEKYNVPNELLEFGVSISPSSIHECHTLVLDSDLLVDSLAAIVEVEVVEE